MSYSIVQAIVQVGRFNQQTYVPLTVLETVHQVYKYINCLSKRYVCSLYHELPFFLPICEYMSRHLQNEKGKKRKAHIPFLLTFLVEGKRLKNCGLMKDRGRGPREKQNMEVNSQECQKKKCESIVFIQWKRKQLF